MCVSEGTLTLALSFHFKRRAGMFSRPVEIPTLKKRANANYSASQAFEGEVKREFGRPKLRKISQDMIF